MKLRLAAAAVSVVALIGLSACTDDPAEPATSAPVVTADPATADPVTPAGTAAPQTSTEGLPAQPGTEPTGAESELSFEGDVQTEKIMVGPQEVEVPKGMKLPEESLVTDAQPASVMMIDEDPAAIIAAVTESAAESGYEVYAQPNESTWVFVGHGNAVLLSAFPQAQILTWGPEAMAEVLAEA